MICQGADRLAMRGIGVGVAGADQDAAEAALLAPSGGTIAVTSPTPSSSRKVRNSGISR